MKSLFHWLAQAIESDVECLQLDRRNRHNADTGYIESTDYVLRFTKDGKTYDVEIREVE